MYTYYFTFQVVCHSVLFYIIAHKLYSKLQKKVLSLLATSNFKTRINYTTRFLYARYSSFERLFHILCIGRHAILKRNLFRIIIQLSVYMHLKQQFPDNNIKHCSTNITVNCKVKIKCMMFLDIFDPKNKRLKRIFNLMGNIFEF